VDSFLLVLQNKYNRVHETSSLGHLTRGHVFRNIRLSRTKFKHLLASRDAREKAPHCGDYDDSETADGQCDIAILYRKALSIGPVEFDCWVFLASDDSYPTNINKYAVSWCVTECRCLPPLCECCHMIGSTHVPWRTGRATATMMMMMMMIRAWESHCSFLSDCLLHQPPVWCRSIRIHYRCSK
jgi:hypothetical protein